MKPTLEKDLPAQWNANKDSLIKYLQKVHQGIKGYVMDNKGQVVSNARVIVEGIDKYVTTTARGEHWRLLRLNDISTLEFSTPSFQIRIFNSVPFTCELYKNQLFNQVCTYVEIFYM